MRPGRLDRLLYVGPPDARARREILAIRTGKMRVEPELPLEWLAEVVSEFVARPDGGADEQLINPDRGMLWGRDRGAVPGGGTESTGTGHGGDDCG